MPGAAESAHVPLIAYGNYCPGMESKVDGALWLGDSETWSWKAQLYSLRPSPSNCWVARTMELASRGRMGSGHCRYMAGCNLSN